MLAFSAGARLAEWVPYVQAARDADEQNMEALVDDGQLYFRVTRTVAANTELLIWYSDKLAARIGLPELRDDAYVAGKHGRPTSSNGEGTRSGEGGGGCV